MKKLLITLIVGLSVSCSDFLEPKSQSEYIPKEASALNEMLLGNAYPGSTNLELLHLLDDDIMCSNVQAEEDVESDVNLYESIQTYFSWQPDAFIVAEERGFVNRAWDGFYDVIMGANAALDYMEQKTK